MGRILTGLSALALAAPLSAQMGGNTYTYVAFDELEYAPGFDERPVVFDGEGWWGGDFNRLWLKLEGHVATAGGEEGEADLGGEVLYSRAFTSFWNLQGGLRVDHASGTGGETRPRLAVGLQGLARYWFEVEAFAYVGPDGDVTGSLEASYDLLLGQRLILEPEFEIEVASAAIPEFGLGSGFTETAFGARLRYEVEREFAPYLGWSWERLLGDTAEAVRSAGGDPGGSSFVFGLRWWY